MTEIVEAARPHTLDEVVGQDKAIAILRGIVARSQAGGKVPHLLFYGPAGVGKTTAALATIKALIGEGWKENILELNASEQRGIDVVREKIIPWVGQMPHNAPFRCLFLDEADMLTIDSQSALRRLMEKNATTTIFFMTCNKLSKIIDPIQSRCLCIGFRSLTDKELEQIITNVATKGNLPIEPARVASALAHSRGDARRAIHMFTDGENEGDKFLRLDAEIATLFTGKATPSQRIERFVGFLREEGLTETEEVLAAIGEAVLTMRMPDQHKANILVSIGTTAFRCNSVALPLLQLRAMLYAVVV